MNTKALFVDLPNFYSSLLSSSIEEPRLLRDYFLYWLDFDRLAEKLAGEHSTVWVFYSGRRFGPRSDRIQDKCLINYIDRINSQLGVTARDVNIPGQQREPASYLCEQCGHEGVAEWESEKGIDASLTVHLFETLDTWVTAYLLSGDADFVPAVASLRRRGKIVIGAGFSDFSSALVRECYQYVNLRDLFLLEDIAAYQIFKPDGVIHEWLTSEVHSRPDYGDSSEMIELSFEWQGIKIADPYKPYYPVFLIAKGPVDLTGRQQKIEQLKTKFPKHVRETDYERRRVELTISPLAWNGISRRLEEFVSSLGISDEYEALRLGRGYTIKYRFDTNANRYISDT